MQSTRYPAIPVEIARAAEAQFKSDNFYILLGSRLIDHLTPAMDEEFSLPGWESGLSVPILPFVTLFQFIEKVTDLQAAQALDKRLDWKYALHIPVNFAGVPEGVFCQFRKLNKMRREKLIALQTLLERVAADDALKNHIPQPIDAEGMIENVCALNRYNNMFRSMHTALQALSPRAPEWLQQIARPHWFTQYQLAHTTLGEHFDREKPAFPFVELGEDIHYLLDSMCSAEISGLDQLPEVQDLFSIWARHFKISADSRVHMQPYCTSCLLVGFISSQIDLE